MAYSKTLWENNKTKLNAANMNKIEDGIETNSNNMPNGINVDSNNYLILEHGGVEISGQTKKVKLEGGSAGFYRHQLYLTDANGKECIAILISSNNLQIKSVSNLTTVCKPASGYTILGINISTGSTSYESVLIEFVLGSWSMRSSVITKANITRVNDIVTPL